MALAAAKRTYEALHEKRPFHDGTFRSWREKPTELHPYHYNDGVRIWVSGYDLTPDDDFLSPRLPEVPSDGPPGEGGP